MKTFTYADYLDKWPAFIHDFNQELGQALNLPIRFKHKTRGSGTITQVRAKLVGSSLEIVATYENKKKAEDPKDFGTFFSLGLITLSAADKQLLDEAQDMLKTVCDERVKAVNEKCLREAAERRQLQAEIEQNAKALKAKRAAEKRAKKAEETYEDRKANAIKEFEALMAKPRVPSMADEFYFSLGWLAKHIGTLSAAMPDYLESHFVRHFGAEVPHRVVDSKKVGVSGYTSQWSWSFKATLRKPEAIPALLQTYLSQSGEYVKDRDFIWDIVDNYGFKFGRKQDLEAIRDRVPASYLTYFEAGYAA